MVAMATAFKESQNFYQKFIFGMKANFYAKFEANLRTSTYHPLHDFYMNLYLSVHDYCRQIYRKCLRSLEQIVSLNCFLINLLH